MLIDSVILEAIGLSMGALFAISAVLKICGLRQFVGILSAYRLISPSLLFPVAGAIVLAELAGGLFSIIGIGIEKSFGLSAIGILLVVYALAIAINIMRGRYHLDCGCLGSASVRPRIGWPLVWRNAGLAVVALLAAFLESNGRPFVLFDWIAVIGASCTFAVLYPAFNLNLGLSMARKAVL
jgi:hypothetical protein